MNAIRSRTEEHLQSVLSHRSEIRSIDPQHNAGDVELLAQIGYKQELRRHYSTLQVFGIAFSIMGLLPSVASVLSVGLESGPAGLVWGWFLSSIFILCIGISMAFLGSAIPTSGGLYYYTNYYCPDAFRVPLSFMIGCSNSLGLIGGLCSISYGFAVQVLSAVYIQQDGGFEITNAKCYGIFVGCVVTNAFICCLATKQAALLQTISIIVNVFLVLLFIIAVPAGKAHDFNSASFIFTNFENSRDYGTVWSFALSWMPAIWTIGSFDSTIHCSEEAKNAQRAIPFGITGSITACWLLGATMFAGAMGIVLGLLVLINGSAGSGALFSLAIASNQLSWGLPVLLVLLPYGRKRFIPGPFYFGKYISTLINIVSVGWSGYVIVLCMFPDSLHIDKDTMNYTVVINVGVWILALVYYFVWGYRFYTGPKSNLDDTYLEGTAVANVDEILQEKS
ncbi:GABA-specific permease [Candida tropicalis]